MIYLVTRHPGALEWLQHRIIAPFMQLQHLDDSSRIGADDIVVGILPINLVAEICRRGGRYLYLEIDLPQALRGRELSAAQLDELGAALVEYSVQRLSDDTSIV